LEPPDVSFEEVKDKIRLLVGGLSWWQIFKAIRFAWCKARALDEVEGRLLHLRPRVEDPLQLEKTVSRGFTGD